MCCPPTNQHSGTLINDLIESAYKVQLCNDRDEKFATYLRAKVMQCQACVGGGENPPQCPKQATQGFYCQEHYTE
jgi:hypothetical protein